LNRRSALKVVDGKTQRKNRWRRTPNYYNSEFRTPLIDRKRPGAGHRHVLKKQDVRRFIGLLPDWNELSVGLNAIILAEGDGKRDGWQRRGVVAVSAWPINQTMEYEGWYFRAHERIFAQLGIPSRALGDDEFECEFNDSTIRAYQLLHILLHELGHHHDLMTTRSKRRSSRGERFAERYAIEYADRIWESYLNEFGMP
jgi:hypothetical protein